MNAIIPEVLETPRLRARRLRAADGPAVTAMGLDPRVSRTLWPWAGGPTRQDIHDGLERQLDHWERHGFGLWLLCDRGDDTMVGRGGLQITDALGEPCVEAAWAIVPERWGQGLATELARAAVDVAFGALELDELVAITLPDNLASRRVMEKAGFAYDAEVRHVGLLHVLYRRGRPDRP